MVSRDDFYYLRVPSGFLAKNREKLCVVNRNGRDYFRLHLSDEDRDRFVDVRGPGKVDFSSWKVDPSSDGK